MERTLSSCFHSLISILGTYYLPGDDWPSGTGLNRETFPKGFIKQSTYPFKFNPSKDIFPEAERNMR